MAHVPDDAVEVDMGLVTSLAGTVAEDHVFACSQG